jgi:hypothetical protein
VSYSELLSYARRISKFTLPATDREPESPAPETSEGAPGQETNTPTPKESKSEPQTNGNTTPVFTTNGVDKDTLMSGMGAVAIGDGATPSQAQSQGSPVKTTDLPPILARWLNPSAEMPFIPWPGQDNLRIGAMANIQRIENQGMDPTDPKTWDPTKTAEEEAEAMKKAKEEEAANIAEEQRVQREQEAKRAEERRILAANAPAASATQVKSQPESVQYDLDAFDD